ncbi:tyrosine-type recombinase/integrase [Fimbriiglobus ruber]|uniref:Core-binding (CB) domain-containing protein n=1 Tax=Fimbriiglobus ruber TaxID=1908690 RepID=A0A225E036_9BACT|nr:site-specific integrase [Fimbriiglobus ruber]OWK46593.1 hypothetical protein FRUB_00292 [Fimbriiglobus ruber]
MGRRYDFAVDLGDGVKIPYAANPRADRGKWVVAFDDDAGKRKKILTVHDIRGKNPPAEFHEDAAKIIKAVYRPPSLFPSIKNKSWDDCLEEVITTTPNARDETIRSFRAAVKAVKETMPEMGSPLDASDENVRRFAKLWLAGTSKQKRVSVPAKPRSPATLSYYMRALSSFSNHLVQLGVLTRNPWYGFKIEKGERKMKHVPTGDETTHFFAWVYSRYPAWVSLHTLLKIKLISGCRTSDVCQLKTEFLNGNLLVFPAEVVKTKTDRVFPIPDSLREDLKATAGKVHLWEGVFKDIPKFRKMSNGLPESYSWKTVYFVLNNLCREYSDQNPDRPRMTPHGLKRRAITTAVEVIGNEDKAAHLMSVLPETARAHYLDATQVYADAPGQLKIAEALLKMVEPVKANCGTIEEPKAEVEPENRLK